MDDAELLKDLIGLDPLFEDDAANFFLVSEDDSILLRHMDDVVDSSPDKYQDKWTTRGTSQHENKEERHRRPPEQDHSDEV